MEDKKQSIPVSSRWYGIDYLRAFMSIVVVAWHMRLFGTSALFDSNGYLSHLIELSDIINFNILLLAVPIFFLISFFLQTEKWVKKSLNLYSRLERLTYIYCFWTGIFLVVCILEGKLSLIWPNTVAETIQFVVSGGSTVFYFIFSLMLLTILSYNAMRLSINQHKSLTLFCLLLLCGCPAVVSWFDSCQVLTALWNPLNFLIYIFISRLTFHYIGNDTDIIHSKIFIKIVGSIFILFILSAILEWHYLIGINYYNFNGYAFPSYTRISVAAGATCLFLLSFYIQHPSGFIIKLLSDYSLGIYCLHGFVGFYYYRIKPHFSFSINVFIDFFLILVISLVLSILLRRAFHKGLI